MQAGTLSACGPGRVRLAEPVAALSLVCDLGMGQPMGHGLRVCRLALRLAEEVGASPGELRTVFYGSLLRWIGCTGNAHEVASALGDDLAGRTAMATLDHGVAGAVDGFVRTHGRGPEAGLLRGADGWQALAVSHCESAVLLGRWLGLEEPVLVALDQVFERWDGDGLPRRLGGEELLRAGRIMRLAGDAEVFDRLGGPAAAVAAIRGRRGTVYDPGLGDVFAELGAGLLGELGEGSAWEAVLHAEPGPRVHVEGDQVDRALEAMADFADLKAPCFSGHGRAVSALAQRAASVLGLDAADGSGLRRAALVQDVGRVGVSDAVWEHPGRLDDGAREAVRLRPYLTERALSRSAWLAGIADLAASHHERLDGSGYHRRLDARTLSASARVLAAADAYQAMSEDRPHRPALTPSEAARVLRDGVARGEHDADAVSAVLSAAGRPADAPVGSGGLTPREVEVLVLLASGLRNREIAERLVVSPKTVGRHLEHVYAKLGVSTRASATLAAMQRGLVPASRGPVA